MPSSIPSGSRITPSELDPDKGDEFARDEAFSSLAEAERNELDGQAASSDESVGNGSRRPDQPVADDTEISEGSNGLEINDFDDDPVATLPNDQSNRSKGGLPEAQKTDPSGASRT